MTERVINLKSGGSAPTIREGQEVLGPDSVLMNWKAAGGGSTITPSKAYLPVTTVDTAEPVQPAISPKVSVVTPENEDGDPSETPQPEVPVKSLTGPEGAEGTTEPDAAEGATDPDAAEGATEPDAVEEATEPGQSSVETEPGQSSVETEPGQSSVGTEPDTLESSPKASDGAGQSTDGAGQSTDGAGQSTDGAGQNGGYVENSEHKVFRSDQELAQMETQGGGPEDEDVQLNEPPMFDLSSDVLFSTLTNIFVSTKNQNNIADILENIAHDMRNIRLMMEAEHGARRNHFSKK